MELADEVKAKLKRQVEFYFSDSNLPRDKFLLEETGKNTEGYVDISILCAFSRMKNLLKHAATKPEDVPAMAVEAVAAVLRTSDELTVDEDGKRVKRSKALGEKDEINKDINARSLFAEPFPFDANLDEIQEFFTQQGPVNCVRMRRHLNSKDFKGNVFVEFTSVEAMEKVLKLQLEFAGAPMHMEPKTEYVQRKLDERKAARENPKGPTTPASQENIAGTANGAEAHQAVDDVEDEDEGPVRIPLDVDEQPNGAGEPDFSVPAGSHVRVVFPDDADMSQVSWRGISEVLGGKDAGVRHVAVTKDDNDRITEAVVRFRTAEACDEALSLAEGTIKVANVEATISKVTEEEDEKLRAELEERFRAAAENKQQGGGGRGGRGGGRGGRGHYGRGRGRGGRGRGQKRQRDS